MKYRCIIWDWNGTLLDDLDVCIDVMNRILKKSELPLLTVYRYRELFGFPVRNYYSRLGFDFEKEPFEQISQEFIDTYQIESVHAKLNRDCISVLEHFKTTGVKQVILSASRREHLEEQVRYFGVGKYFDRLLGLDHSHATSKIELGKKWLSESGYGSKDVLVVGDTIHDYETAYELGCDCILLSAGHQSRERVSCLGVPVVESLDEVALFLSGMVHSQ